MKDHIAAGDCYQVVLSQRFSAQFSGDPLQIYRALRAINPSPYMFFLRHGRRDGGWRFAGDAGALSWPATRLSSDRGHEKTRRDGNRRLDVERGSEDRMRKRSRNT